MKNLWNTAPCAILAFDEKDGAIRAANRFCCEALGYSAGELGHLKFEDVLTIPALIFHQTHFLPLLRLHGRASEIFLTLREKSGGTVPMLANAAIKSWDAERRCVVCAFLPVHERRKYEDEILAAKRKAEEALNSNEELKRSREELEQRLQELDLNLAEVAHRNSELLRLGEIFSHDLREPIRKIRAFSDLILQENGQELNSNSKQGLSRIVLSCERAGELLQTLQQYLWLDSDPEIAAIHDLNQIVETARSRLKAPVELMKDDLPALLGRAGQLVTLFESLFRSAVARAQNGPANIQITSCQVQRNSFRKVSGKYRYIDFALLVVSDDGQPFGDETDASLFRLLRKQSGQNSHPDLGICRKIVENHHGAISFEEGRESGAAFRILLPMRAIRERA